MRPDASVVVCAYTLARWDSLVAGVRSLARQTLAPAEVIVVIDHEPELLERAVECLPRELAGVRVLPSQGRRGLSGARNTGVAAASGRIIAFLDDDATADPEWLARLVEPYDDATVMATGGACLPAWESGRPGWFPHEFDWVVGCSYRGLPQTVAEIRNPIGAGMSIRSSALAVAGAFREDIGRVGRNPLGCEETEVAIRIRQRVSGARVLHVPRARVRHAVPSDRSTVRYFLRRCHAEGLSKARVVASAGADGLSSERAYVSRVLPVALGRSLQSAATGDGSGLARAAMIFAGVTATALGYLRGSLSRTAVKV